MSKLLVIDDEIDICETIKRFFEQRGYKVIYALTGKGGIDAFETEEPFLVILDLCLKDMSGLDVLKRIKVKKPTCSTIVITASASEDDRRKAIKLGVDYYLTKPFSFVILNAMVAALL